MARGIISNRGKVEVTTGGTTVTQSEITGQTGITITFNDKYSFGVSGVLFYRNGVLMDKVATFNPSGTANAEEYIEVNNGVESTQITLNSTNPAVADELFQMVFMEGTDGAGGGTSIEILQTAHGFAIGNGVYHNGTNWAKGLADDEATLSTYVITEIIDVDNFVAFQFGRVEAPAHGFTPGQYYFLSDTVAGEAISIPTNTGYSCPLFYAEDIDFLQVMVYRPAASANDVDLTELGDVTINSPQDGNALVYNEGTAQWEAKTPGSAGGSDIYHVFNLDGYGKLSDVFVAGDVTRTEETSLPLNAKKSLKLEFGAGVVADDRAIINGIVANRRCKTSPVHKCSFVYKYTGAKGAIDVVIKGNLPSEEIIRFPLDPDKSKCSFMFSHKLDSFPTQTLRFVATGVEAANAEIIIDDIEFSDEPYHSGVITKFSSTNFNDIGHTGTGDYNFDVLKPVDFNSKGIFHTETDRVVFDRDCQIDVDFVNTFISTTSGGGRYTKGYLYDASGILITDTGNIQAAVSNGGGIGASASIKKEVKSGSYITYSCSYASNVSTSSRMYASLSVSMQSETVQFEDNSGAIGEIVTQAAELSTPEGTIYCDGAAVSRSHYSSLFGKIGTTYGAGDGSTTFNLPDLRGQFLRGVDDGRGLDAGRVFGTDQDDLVGPSIKTVNTLSGQAYNVDPSGSPLVAKGANAASLSSYDFGAGTETRPVNVTVKYYIRYTGTPRMLAVKSSLENDFDVDASSAGVLSNFNGASDWCEFSNKGGTGYYNYKVNTDIFTVFPLLGVEGTYGHISGAVHYDMFPSFRVYLSQVASDAFADAPHQITAKKRGADRSDRHTPVVNGDDVVKEKVMYVHVHSNPTVHLKGDAGSSTFKPRSLESLSGDIFGSISNDQLSLPSDGKYEVVFSVGSKNAAYVNAQIYDVNNSTSVEDFINVAYESSNTAMSIGEVSCILNTTSTLNLIEFRTSCSAGSGTETISRIKIRKIL